MRGCIIYLNPFNVHCSVFACLIKWYLSVFGKVSYSHTRPLRSGFDGIKTWYLYWLPGKSLLEKGGKPLHLSATELRQNRLCGPPEFSLDTTPGEVHERRSTECIGKQTA